MHLIGQSIPFLVSLHLQPSVLYQHQKAGTWEKHTHGPGREPLTSLTLKLVRKTDEKSTTKVHLLKR